MKTLVKLVRDKIVPHGTNFTYRHEPINSVDTHIRLLRKKLIEEALEYQETPTVEELADVLQVIYDLVVVDLNRNMHVIELERITKLDKRGGFTGGTAMYVYH